MGQQGESCLQGFVPHREGQGGVQGVGDFPPRRRDGVAAVGLLGHIALGHQRGQGVLRLKIVGQALFLDDARQVLAGQRGVHAGQDIAEQNADIVLFQRPPGSTPGAESVLLHGRGPFF